MKQTGIKKKSTFNQNLPFLIMCLPVMFYVICFKFLPLFGMVVSFKDYNYIDGIWGSPWVGLKHFEFFFSSNDVYHILGNTVGYFFLFYIVKTICSIAVAFMFYFVASNKALKYYQTVYTLPNFISWVLVAYIAFTLFSSEYGMMNTIIEAFGGEGISWYSEPKYWPVILLFFHVWQAVGMNCIIYYAALMGIDESLIEAAKLDGANLRQIIWHIMIPTITPIISILAILAVGSIMTAGFGLFYQVPMDSAALYPTTDVIDTYIYRTLVSGNMGQTSAVGMFQSLVGGFLLLTVNGIVKKISPDNAVF